MCVLCNHLIFKTHNLSFEVTFPSGKYLNILDVSKKRNNSIYSECLTIENFKLLSPEFIILDYVKLKTI